MSDRARGYAALALLLGALAFFLHWVDRFYPVTHWLAWRYAAYWAVALGWLSCVTSCGEWVVRKVRGRSLPLREHLVQSVAVGFLVFVLGWFTLGVLGGVRSWIALVWPLAMGVPNAWSLFKRLRRANSLARRLASSRARPALWFAALAFGVVGLALVYAPLLSPDNAAFDARMYHQAIGEHYVAARAIVPFREGWFMGAYPQAVSYLFAWAYCLRGMLETQVGVLFDQVELCFHLEFVIFGYTLASIPVLVRRLAPRSKVRLAWVALFAFPELFCYDSLLSGAADHVAAALAIPLFLALLRALPRLSVRECSLLGLVAGVILLTKYSVYAMVMVAGAAVGSRALWLALGSWRRQPIARESNWLKGPLALAGVALVTSTPHWLKNLFWHGDPLYPLLHRVLPSRPWPAGAELKMPWFIPQGWVAERSLDGVVETIKAAATFSFIPHDWWEMHRDVPIFGSLFTLSVPCLLLLRRPGRLWLLYVAVHFCVMQWFWSFHQDRYLQSYVPWMAAGIAAVAGQLWRQGFPARLGVALLAAGQLIWGGDVPFFPTHSMSGSGLKTSIDLLSTGFRGDHKHRLKVWGAWSDLRSALPRDAVVMIHEEHLRSGLGARSISDAAGWQAAIDYARPGSRRGVYDLLQSYGVTHLMWLTDTSRVFDSVAADIAFFDFALNAAEKTKRIGGYSLGRMPKRPPTKTSRGKTAVFACGDTYANGLYATSQLAVYPTPTPRPKSDYPPPEEPFASIADLEAAKGRFDSLVLNPSCGSPSDAVMKRFTLAANRGNDRIYVRRDD